jgi:hypothetical protein
MPIPSPQDSTKPRIISALVIPLIKTTKCLTLATWRVAELFIVPVLYGCPSNTTSLITVRQKLQCGGELDIFFFQNGRIFTTSCQFSMTFPTSFYSFFSGQTHPVLATSPIRIPLTPSNLVSPERPALLRKSRENKPKGGFSKLIRQRRPSWTREREWILSRDVLM